MDSTGALDMEEIPGSLLIVGGGYVALELGMVYASLGSRVTLTVRSDRLLRGADLDLAAPLTRRLNEIFEAVLFNRKPVSLKERDGGVEVQFEGEGASSKQYFDRVLVAIGRQPNSQEMGLDKTGVKIDGKGFIVADEKRRTTDERIYAVGDVTGGPLLAHKAMREGKVAAEVIVGEPSAFDPRAIPCVVYTDPQVAWCGLTEEEARSQRRPVKVERFPWKYSSRAITVNAPDGLTKLIVEPETGRILGVGISGRAAEGMISEGALAVEMGAVAEDMGLTIHPHPTFSETMGEVAELFLGSATNILPKEERK